MTRYRRALNIFLAVAVGVHASGCAHTLAEADRKWLPKGMTREEVREEIGVPVDRFQVPGQGEAAQAVVEIWRYHYQTSRALIVLLAVTFVGILLIPLIDGFDVYSLDLGFDARGRLRSLSTVEKVGG